MGKVLGKALKLDAVKSPVFLRVILAPRTFVSHPGVWVSGTVRNTLFKNQDQSPGGSAIPSRITGFTQA